MTKQHQRRAAILLGAAAGLLLLLTLWTFLRPLSAAEAPVLPLPAERTLPAEDAFRLDLNDATEAELQSLPGVGPVLAGRILDRRAELGAFRTRDDVLSVPGIGEATYEKIEPYITYG